MVLYIIKNGELRHMDAEELYHYGVIGMKWGVRRAAAKSKSIGKLQKRAETYDKISAAFKKKADAIQAKRFRKSTALINKSNELMKKAASTKDKTERLLIEQKASKLNLKAQKVKIREDKLSRSTAYERKAMWYTLASDRFKSGAIKARSRVTSNKAYIAMMDKRLSSLSKEKIRQVEQPIGEWIKESITRGK